MSANAHESVDLSCLRDARGDIHKAMEAMGLSTHDQQTTLDLAKAAVQGLEKQLAEGLAVFIALAKVEGVPMAGKLATQTAEKGAEECKAIIRDGKVSRSGWQEARISYCAAATAHLAAAMLSGVMETDAIMQETNKATPPPNGNYI